MRRLPILPIGCSLLICQSLPLVHVHNFHQQSTCGSPHGCEGNVQFWSPALSLIFIERLLVGALASILDCDRHADVVAYSNPHALGLPIDANFMGSTPNQDFASQFPVAHFFLFTHEGGCVLRAGRQAGPLLTFVSFAIATPAPVTKKDPRKFTCKGPEG